MDPSILNIRKRCYIIYDIEVEGSIDMIVNPGTELEYRTEAKCVHNFEFAPSVYVYVMEMPDSNFLREKNSVVFEITYAPQLMFRCSYYSERYGFSLNDGLTNYFMIGLKFKPSLQNLLFIEPPGKALNNNIKEFCYLFYYLMKDNSNLVEKGIKQGRKDPNWASNESFKLIQDLIEVFKIMNNNNIYTNSKSIVDFFKYMDDYIITGLKYKDSPQLLVMLTCMYGIFPYDFFTGRETACKNTHLLLNAISKVSVDFFNLLLPEGLKDLKDYFTNGYFILINMAIKEGYSDWVYSVKSNHDKFLADETNFWNRVYDYIRKSGSSMKTKEGFVDAKKALLMSYHSREKDLQNPKLIFSQLLKNIGILSMNKENLLETVLEFFESKHIDFERLRTLKDEIKRKKWEIEEEKNYETYIVKLMAIIAAETGQIKDEFKSLLYENTSTIRYLFTVLRTYKFEGVDSYLLKKCMNAISDMSLDDYSIVLTDMKSMKESLKIEVMESGFFDRLKNTLKKLSLPFSPGTQNNLRVILLELEIFPTGSLDFIREFIRNKPSFDDLFFIVNELVYPQKRFNTTKNYNDLWLNIKNHLVNVFIEIYDLIRHTSIIISALPETDEAEEPLPRGSKAQYLNKQSNLDFKKWLSDEFWKSVNQRYSIDVFLSLTHIFNPDKVDVLVTNETMKMSYFKNTRAILEAYCNEIVLSSNPNVSYDKVNIYFSSISMINDDEEKVVLCNNENTQELILMVLEKLYKAYKPALVIKYLLESPSKECFWYKLLKSHGANSKNIIESIYLQSIKKSVVETYQSIITGDASIHDFILMDKQNNIQREAMIAYFLHIELLNSPIVAEDKKALKEKIEERRAKISESINEQMVVLNRNLKIVSDLESFFGNYGKRIQNSDDYNSFLKLIKNNFKTTEFKNFKIRDDLESITSQVQTINQWNETVMFRNILDNLYYAKSHEGVIEKTEEDEVVEAKLPIETVLALCDQAQSHIKLTLNDILVNSDFSKLTLSLTKKYFKGLEDSVKESTVINRMLSLEESQLATLNSILTTFCEITNFIKFSNTLISLDKIYKFKSNHTTVYLEFISLINNVDSSFDKIYNASKKLAELRNKYIEGRNIENVLYELSEDQDLIIFLLNTPEDDIRNMVDAVDEHGDSFIRVQTIRDLLIIGSFVRRLALKEIKPDDSSSNPTEEEFVERIHSVFGKNNFQGIEVLMNSCSKQFTGIKHLHSELSNREEASKIKAKEISKQSRFEFAFNKERNNYEVTCYYGKSNKKINFRDLCDLRDRVLLLLYNEKEQKEDAAKDVVGLNKKVSQNFDDEALLKKNSTVVPQQLSLRDILSSFIQSVEISEKILFVLQDIFHNGYPVHFTSNINLKEGQYQAFTNMYNEMATLNKNWNEDLKDAYTKYYALSMFTGNQFWELESLLLKTSKSGTEDIDHLPGFYLLKFANPLIKSGDLDKVAGCYSEVDQTVLNNMKPKERMFKLGEAVGQLFDVNYIGAKSLPKDTKKVQLNLKGNKFVFSSISNMKIYNYLLSIHISLENTVPASSQIFYCSKGTTFHELISFLYRTFYSPVERLFTIIKVENLSFELQNFLVEQVNKLSKIKHTIKGTLSIICSDPDSFLHTQFSESNHLYLMRDFDVLDEVLIANSLKQLNLGITIVRSDDTGAGKTFFIKSKVNSEKHEYVDFPIVDCISKEKINERLFLNNKSSKNSTDKFIHITVMGIIDDYEMLDYLLFSYLIIGNVSSELNVSFRELSDPVYIEVANTFNDFLFSAISIFNLIPDTEFLVAEENLKNIKINKEYTDPLQLVTNYLHYYDQEQLNEIDINPEVEQNVRTYSKEECFTLLQKYFIKNKPDLTFRQVNIFLAVLANQLDKFSQNYYFSVENIGYIQEESLLTIRQKIMTALLQMTEEFTTRSIKEAREQQNATVFKLKRSYSREEHRDNEEAKQDEFDSLSHVLSWSSSNHLLVMFHADGMCVTPVYREADKVTNEIRELVESQRTNLEDYQVFSHFELLEKLLNIVGKDFELDRLAKQTSYILTADNFLKMLLIIMRSRCRVPIVIMGETGCGKTSLVKFLACEIMQEGFQVINFHAGIKEHHILEKMEEVIQMAFSAKITDNSIWVFLDEINTCDCLGLITELIVSRTMLGKKLPDNIVFIAACNPYKVRRAKGEVGLIKQRVATRLVYRVHPLPDSLIDYVWDYGSLSDKEERLYIGNILQDISGEIKETSIDLVCKSQQFIRKAEDKYSVSLRDVARFNILHEWFFKMLTQKNEDLLKEKGFNNIQYLNYYNYFGNTNFQAIKYTGKLMVSKKALILSLMMCYYNRISKNSDRNEYKLTISSALKITVKELDEMINEEQRDMVTRMELPPAIAINKALLENVFTLMVCVINKIPLFICGKPGCSKSLSVQLLVSNLRGADSHDNFFKKLPRILAIPYQGSESSTSEGIEKIFEKARGVLNNSQDDSILPLIVFDEIGLAEISKNNPLKILHSLLEPEKAELAFVGISNWRLDASKMNRAVYLARPDPDLEDLENTALSIFEYYIKEPRFDERQIMKAIAKTYYEFKKAQREAGHSDFHGTRDFYALLKQVTREFNQNYSNYNEMKLPILRDALCRNFGGLETSIPSILEIFARNMNLSNEFINPTENPKLQISNDVINLVKENLKDRDSRFLLLFTNGESASYILDNYLKSSLRERIFIIGSEFANDKDKEEHSFKLLSDIILYMESGNSIIMKNLDQIYGSLYDLFNQNFMIVGEKKNCRIALGSTNNPMCYVNNNFHCVVLVDLKDLSRMDPPFLNRFEKQILTFETILSPRQKKIVRELNSWIKQLTSLANASGQSNNIDITDLIITYNDEMAPSIVLTHFSEEKNDEDVLELCKKDVLSVSSISLIVYSILSSMYQNARDEVLKSHRIYFEEQHHDSLDMYLSSLVKNKPFENRALVYTYSNILDEFLVQSVSIDKKDPVENVIQEEAENKEDDTNTNENNNENNMVVESNEGMEKLDNENTVTNNTKEKKYKEIKVHYEKGSVSNSQNFYIINIAELKAEKEFDSRFKHFLSDPLLEWVLIKFDADKEKKHIPMIKFKVDKFLQEAKKALGENETLPKNVLMLIYLSRKQAGKEDQTIMDKFSSRMNNDSNNDKLESHFLSGWNQNMVDCLAGGQIENLKSLLDLTTIEIIKKKIDQKSIAEIIFEIYLKFNFNTYNPNDSSLVKLYMTESIHKIENDSSIFEVIFKKCLEFLEEKELPDWKLQICCDTKILSKSVNTFSAIKMVIKDIVSDPLLKIIHYLETESALSSYFHEETTVEKAEIFKKIWIEQFDKKDLNAIYPYNVVQSLNVNCVFSLTFPFSKSDIYEVASGLKSHIDTVYMLDSAAYNFFSVARQSKNEELNQKLLEEETFKDMNMSFKTELEAINKRVKSSILFKIMNKYSERSLEYCYISDLISYFTIVELKKEHKWKNCLEILVRKCIGFDIEKLEYIYIFLFKNRKILDSIFNVFTSLQHVYDVQFIENVLLKDAIYDKNITNVTELHLRKEAEALTFLNIFNVFSQVIISQLNSLKTVYEKSKEDLYGKMLNVFISSLLNFSLEIETHPDALNVIVVVNEFLKFLSNVFNNNKEEIAKRAIGIVSEEYEKIVITDFTLVKEILNVIDKEMNDLNERAKNPDNDIPSNMVSNMRTNVISSKLTIFESVLNGNCEYENKKIIVENILKDAELTRYSAMIFKLIYKDCVISEDTKELMNHPISAVIATILDDDNPIYDYNGTIGCFFSDFFRKFFEFPDKIDHLRYLEKNHENFANILATCHISNKSTSKYNRLIGFNLIKHYLDIYAMYISDSTVPVKDPEISEKMNKILENPESFVDILKNFILKTFASKIGGAAAGLVNVDYSAINVRWVNNKVFETNDNALGLEPNLIAFEKLNKEYSLFFIALLNEDSKEVIDRFKNLVKDAKERSELKFIIIQFFINKVWLSYSNPKFVNSHTLKFVRNLLETVKQDLTDNLGLPAFKFIEKLTYNFLSTEVDPKLETNSKATKKNENYFTISSATESNKVGMMILGLQAYNMVLSFKTSEFCLNKLFYNDKDVLLHNFDHFKGMFIPGGFADYHDENILLMMKHIDENYSIYGTQMGLYECICGFLYTIGDCTRPYYIGTCPNCSGQIGGMGHKLLDGHKSLINADNRNEEGRKKFVLNYLKGKLRNIAGYISKMADELSVHYCIRTTSAIGFRFLNHIMSTILLLLKETEVVSEKALDDLVEIKGLKIKATDYLTKHLQFDLIKLSELIKSKEYYVFMHVVLGEFFELCKEGFKFDNSIEREKLEVAFQTRIIAPKMDRLAGEISDFKQYFITDKKLTYLSIIDEDYNENEITSLNNYTYYRCFRFTRIGNWEDLKNEFMRNKRSDINYQMMKILAERFDELQLVGNLYPIIQFTNYMLNLCNYRFSRAEAKEKKIRDIIEGNEVAEKLFFDFCNAWSKIAYKVTQWACKQLPVLDRIDADLPLSFVLVDDRELGYGMYMCAAYQYLSGIQNEVLEAIVYLIKENNNYQIWGNMDTFKYPVQKISPHEIVMYQTETNYVQVLTDEFAKFYDIYNPKFGQGGIVEYNFEKIESELAFKLLTNKKFVNHEDLNKVQYKFELLSIQNKHSNLLADIRSKVAQSMLSFDDSKEIRKSLERVEKQNVAYLHQIFSSLEIVLCNLRYGDAGVNENTSVATYIGRLPASDKISSFLKTTEPLNSVNLANILSYYALVEEQLFKYIIEFISPDYCHPLEDDVVREILKWWQNFYEYAQDRYPSPEQLIKVIQRFIIRCLVASVRPDTPIKEYLNRMDFWDVDMLEEVVDNFYFEFPDSVNVANTMSFLDLMKEYHRSRSDDGRGVDFTSDKYKFDAIREEIFKKQNKFN